MEELAAGIRRRAAVLYKIMSVGRAIRTAGYDKLMLRVANPKQWGGIAGITGHSINTVRRIKQIKEI